MKKKQPKSCQHQDVYNFITECGNKKQRQSAQTSTHDTGGGRTNTQSTGMQAIPCLKKDSNVMIFGEFLFTAITYRPAYL